MKFVVLLLVMHAVMYIIQRMIGMVNWNRFLSILNNFGFQRNFLKFSVQFPPVPKPDPRDIPLPKEGFPTFKVLHLSDTHYDPYYTEGTNADCNEPLCCRLTHGRPHTPHNAAGKLPPLPIAQKSISSSILFF